MILSSPAASVACQRQPWRARAQSNDAGSSSTLITLVAVTDGRCSGLFVTSTHRVIMVQRIGGASGAALNRLRSWLIPSASVRRTMGLGAAPATRPSTTRRAPDLCRGGQSERAIGLLPALVSCHKKPTMGLVVFR